MAHDRLILAGMIFVLVISLTANIPSVIAVYSQVMVSGNTTKNANVSSGILSNTSNITINLKGDTGDNYSSALTAITGAGGALAGSLLTYFATMRANKFERQRKRKYDSSLREMVVNEFNDYSKFLDSVILQINQIYNTSR